MRATPKYLSRAALLSFALVATGHAIAKDLAQPAAAPAVAKPAVFATVGESVITQEDYNAAFMMATREKFYHGKPPDGQIALLQREVGDKLVTSALLLREARQRGLIPDAAEIQKKVEALDQRYAGSEQWKNSRAQSLPPLVARLEQESLLSQLEKAVRARAMSSEKEVEAYYAANLEKFTEPEQSRVSVILLAVDPSSPSETWLKFDAQALAIAQQARAGADFSALARQHSSDESAQQGGDMGYLHSGMLPDGTQEVVAKLKAGEISDPVRVLQGFAVFRLTDRKASRLHAFPAIKVRAQELALRDQAESTWLAFVADLKMKTPSKIDQSKFLPLVEPTGAAPAPAHHRATPK